MKVKILYKRIFKYILTVLFLYLIITNLGWKKIVDTVSHARYEWLFGGGGLFLISILFGAIQWHVLLKNKNIKLPFSKVFTIYFMGIFFNNILFGAVASDAFKVAKLHFNKSDGKAVFAATILDRLAGLIALSFFAIVGGAVIFTLNIQQNKQFFMVICSLAVFVTIFFSFFLLLLSQRLQNLLRKIIITLPEFPLKKTIQSTVEVTFLNRRGTKDKRMLLQVAILSLWVQSLRIGVNIFCAQSLGIFSLSTIHYFFVITAAIALLMIVPMPLGVREAIGGMLFGFAGFSIEESVIMLFLATVVNVTTSLFGGFLFLFEKSKSPVDEVKNGTCLFQ